MHCEEYNDTCADIRKRKECQRPKCRRFIPGAPRKAVLRDVRRYVDWTRQEWDSLVAGAEREGLSYRDYQRIKTLRPGPAVIHTDPQAAEEYW